MIRRVLSFSDCMSALPEGFKAMVPAVLILTMAWTLKAMTDSLGAAEFVEEAMKASAQEFMMFCRLLLSLWAAALPLQQERPGEPLVF